jgi:hypothetical protein
MMIKRGVIDEADTIPESAVEKRGADKADRRDTLADHPATRAAAAVAETVRKKAPVRAAD